MTYLRMTQIFRVCRHLLSHIRRDFFFYPKASKTKLCVKWSCHFSKIAYFLARILENRKKCRFPNRRSIKMKTYVFCSMPFGWVPSFLSESSSHHDDRATFPTKHRGEKHLFLQLGKFHGVMSIGKNLRLFS